MICQKIFGDANIDNNLNFDDSDEEDSASENFYLVAEEGSTQIDTKMTRSFESDLSISINFPEVRKEYIQSG